MAERVLSPTDVALIDAYWRAANYVSVGQIYLLDNPLVREPLRPEHVKPRLLGHWGTAPGLNFIYAHMNRVIRNWGLDAIYESPQPASDCGGCLGPPTSGCSFSTVVSRARLPRRSVVWRSA